MRGVHHRQVARRILVPKSLSGKLATIFKLTRYPYLHLLRNMAIFEYNGSELWYDVNPLIERIHAFQKAK